MDIRTMRELIRTVDEKNIPEEYLKGKEVNNTEDINRLVTDWGELVASTAALENQDIDKQSAQADADISAWAASRAGV